MANKFDVFKYVYDNTEDKDSVINEFPEEIREDMRKSLETGDEGLFVQLLTPTALSENGPAEVDNTAPAPASVETASIPEGDVTDIAQANMEVVQEMNDDIHEATPEEVQALPEEIQEGVEIWRDASEDMSRTIMLATYNHLKNMGADFSEEQVLCTGATIAKDLQESGYGKTSLNRATENLDSIANAQALEKLYAVKDEMESLKCSAEDLVDYISEKDNIGLTPSQRDQLVQIILDNGIFTNESENHDVRKDVLDVINTSGDYSIGNPTRKLAILNDFMGYEFSMENCDPCTVGILSSFGNFDASLNDVKSAIGKLEGDFATAKNAYHHAYGTSWGPEMDSRITSKTLNDTFKLNAINEEARANKLTDARATDQIMKSESKYQNAYRPVGFFENNYTETKIGPVRFGHGKKGMGQAVVGQISDYLDNRSDRMTKLGIAQAKADAKVKMAQADAMARAAKYSDQTGRDVVGLAYAQNGGYPAPRGFSAESVDCAGTKDEGGLLENTMKGLDNFGKSAKEGLKSSGAGFGAVLPTVGLVGAGAYLLNKSNQKAALQRAMMMNNPQMMYGQMSENENDATEDQILMEDEALDALIAKYNMLPTLEAKNAMIQDALEHGIPQEYINAMIQRSSGEFSEDEGIESAEGAENTESIPSEQDEMVAQQVLDTIESLGSDEIAQNGEVTAPIDPLDGTLPAGVIEGEGGTQAEMIQNIPEEAVSEGGVFADAPVISEEEDSQFESTI